MLLTVFQKNKKLQSLKYAKIHEIFSAQLNIVDFSYINSDVKTSLKYEKLFSAEL